jgi:ribosomal protein L11 methyltransferase
MRWAKIDVVVPAESAEAVSEILIQAGSPGISEVGTHPQTLTGFLPVSEDLMPAYEALEDRLARLVDFGLSAPLECTLSYAGDQDWADAWKKYWKPVEFGKRLVIKPSWEEYAGDPERLIVELDPGMAFGTGGHPTTKLCLEALEDYVQPGAVVADIGAGSGILSLTAAKLGAARVHATDIDKLPRDISRENVERNGLGAVVTIHEVEEFDRAAKNCDLVVANILASVIIDLALSIAARLRPGGIFIGSGIVEERIDDVLAALKDTGFEIVEVRCDEIWRAVVGRKTD